MSMIYILVGPSGAGKDYLLGRLLFDHPELYSIPSYTTRSPRTVQAAHKFHYVTQNEFDDAWKHGKILEKVIEHGHLYGTDKEALGRALTNGQTAITTVESRGVESFKKIYKDKVISLYIDPGPIKDLEHRIRTDPNRTGQTEKEIETRLARAKTEMDYKEKADFVILNTDGKQNDALRQLERIITEKMKSGA